MSDDEADFFSFGSSEVGGVASLEVDGGENIGALVDAKNTPSTDASEPSSSSLPVDRGLPRQSSTDSFTELLEADEDSMFLGTLAISSTYTRTSMTEHDKDTQEMLHWLEEDPKGEKPVEFDGDDEVVFVSDDEISATTSSSPGKPRSPSMEQTTALQHEVSSIVVESSPKFDNLQEALASPKASVNQIRLLAQKTSADALDDPTVRPDLYCRLICGGKNTQQTQTSSLADSFLSWVEEHKDDEDDEQKTGIVNAAQFCMDTILKDSANVTSKEGLIDLLRYNIKRPNAKSSEEGKRGMDVLVPCVAATILSAGIPLAAASVVLGKVQADYMPLLALHEEERWDAALALHHALYLLAWYHLPLLVLHLDRHIPGWFGPRIEEYDDLDRELAESDSKNVTVLARHLEKQGHIPSSWLLSFLSGEVHGRNLPPNQVLRLWDAQLTQAVDSAHCFRFFLTLAVLERSADELILVTQDELIRKLEEAFVFPGNNEPWFKEWLVAAQDLYKATPTSVLKKLRTAEDEAVQSALMARQARAETALQERLQAEAAAHQAAQERKAEEARQRLTRARLVAFYRKHAPDKEENIDRILTNYDGRLDVLDAKLCRKYGESFQPALKPKEQQRPQVKQRPGGLLRGLSRRQTEAGVLAEGETTSHESGHVSVLVSASEVLPIICWSKGAPPPGRGDDSEWSHPPLKYFLVDSRSEYAAIEQGRFPTAATLNPETLLDPERVMELEEMFEALRSAVHIVIMGEGVSAIPDLYKQKLTPKLAEAAIQDESRTNICALFFIKKGFPFVSVLEGGFAAAHSWLVREGKNHNLRASSVLVDYDPEGSIFGQMETLHNATATEKVQRQLNNLVEKSLVAMTLQAQQLEKLAEEMEAKSKSGGIGGLRLGSLFRSVNSSATSSEATAASSPLRAKSPEPPSQTESGGEGTAHRNDADRQSPTPTKSPNPNETSGRPSSNPIGGMPTILKRNPFRFGGSSKPISNRSTHNPLHTGEGSDPSGKTKNHERSKSAVSGPLSGLANLRKSTLGRMRSVPGDISENKEKSTRSNDEEELISFD